MSATSPDASKPSFNSAQQSATRRNAGKIISELRNAYILSLKELTQEQHRAIELLLRGWSDAQVADELKVDRGTVFRWRKSPRFAHTLDVHRRKRMEQSTARLQSLLDPALDILQKQLNGDDQKTALRAAAILVRLATPSRLSLPARSEKSKPPRDPSLQAMEDYVNAPMPDGSTSERITIDDDDDEDDDGD